MNEPVKWPGYDNNTGEEIMVRDEHTHQMEYLGTDILTAESIRQTQKQNAEAMAVAQTFEKPERFENEEVSMEPAGAR